MMAQESDDPKELEAAFSQILTECTFNKVKNRQYAYV